MSLIGESWGGIIALKMAQILEAQGTLVSISLLEGDPEYLAGLAGSFLSNDNFTNKLNTIYSSFSNEVNFVSYLFIYNTTSTLLSLNFLNNIIYKIPFRSFFIMPTVYNILL